MAPTSSTAPNHGTATSFGVAFQRLKNSVSKDDARNFTSTSMEDVWKAARQIERQLQHEGSLRGFHRIEPFLAGIEKYAGVIEVLCQGTPYLPYIWVGLIMPLLGLSRLPCVQAPIKLLLQVRVVSTTKEEAAMPEVKILVISKLTYVEPTRSPRATYQLWRSLSTLMP